MPPNESQPPPNWEPVEEPRTIFRFVQHDSQNHPDFASNFIPDAENPNQQALEDEHPDFRLGMSVFASCRQAKAVWAGIVAKVEAAASSRNKRRNRPLKIKVGHYIAEVLLAPGHGFELAGPPDERGHMTLKGPAQALAAATRNVYPAARDGT
jgi:hypothetical protein